MRTLLAFLITLGIFSVAIAQDSAPKELFKPGPKLKQDTSILKIPGFKPTNPFSDDSVFNYQLPNPESPFKKNDNITSQASSDSYDPFKMPIAGLEMHSNLNMPVWVPDSTVNYSLMIKKPGSTWYKGNNPLPDSEIVQQGIKK
ncbi:hypothetical protein GM418_10160 [Maribellus comscasis]|uniref:Uncharacterized protein n=1 Tax=Maribellus comscasis TaxID=2681766 RepID=A0A6I6JM90_9BACT|nr:hypothetical protein [Maribellus comscasis]QGY44006.1 hypothetical protein GM418_10160 [Maribellus comscasis]